MLDDVVVVGAGPVGSTLALALTDGDVGVTVLDARAAGRPGRGDRSLALAHGSRLILERIGIWDALSAIPGALTPITRIDISQAGGFGQTQLAADEVGVPALGYVVSYRALQAELDSALGRSRVGMRHGISVTAVRGGGECATIEITGEAGDAMLKPVPARLAAVADGTGDAMAFAPRQRHDYGQVALVAKLSPESPHGGTAFERFTPFGPIALLPHHDGYGLVWTATPVRAQQLLALSDDEFLADLARHFGTRSCRFTRVFDRRTFPLVMEYARDPARARCIALGNAAQTLHPVAGQGFNLGLRDAWELAQIVLDTPREEIGGDAMLGRYARGRRTDRMAGIAFTHALVRLFGNDPSLLRWPRGLALTMLDAVPAAKRAFTRAMLFGVR